uniref:Uncharacterized protein n=1 Tax=Rhizophora mucronata TaxID=61149 RepID=A0A2P2LH46_RHIMU
MQNASLGFFCEKWHMGYFYFVRLAVCAFLTCWTGGFCFSCRNSDVVIMCESLMFSAFLNLYNFYCNAVDLFFTSF